MSDTFDIPVTYKGKEAVFPARVVPRGYVYQIEVDVYGDKVLFEPDEERNFRAVLPPEAEASGKIEIDLLQAIAATIEDAVK